MEVHEHAYTCMHSSRAHLTAVFEQVGEATVCSESCISFAEMPTATR